jgi:hypothetical protein
MYHIILLQVSSFQRLSVKTIPNTQTAYLSLLVPQDTCIGVFFYKIDKGRFPDDDSIFSMKCPDVKYETIICWGWSSKKLKSNMFSLVDAYIHLLSEFDKKTVDHKAYNFLTKITRDLWSPSFEEKERYLLPMTCLERWGLKVSTWCYITFASSPLQPKGQIISQIIYIRLKPIKNCIYGCN